MRIIVSAEELKEKLTKIKPYLNTSPKIVQHGEMQIEADETIKLKTYDGDTLAEAEVTGEILEKGSILVNPKGVTQLLSFIKKESRLELSITKKNDLEIKNENNSPYYFRGSIGHHPGIGIREETYQKVDFTLLEKALNSIKDTIGTQGVQLYSSEETLSLNATDNYRLGHSELLNSGFGEFTGGVPEAILDKISKLPINKIYYDKISKTLTFGCEDYKIQTRLLVNDFPNVEGLLETKPEETFSLNRQNLLQKLKKLESVAENTAIKIYNEHTTIILEGKNTDVGYGKEEIKADKLNRDEIETYIHIKYLIQAVSALEGEEIVFHYSSSLAPLFVTTKNPTKSLHVIMPVRA